MQSALAHIESLAPKDAAVARILGGVSELLTGVQEKFVDCAAEKEEYRQKLEAPAVEVTNIVADGCQSDVIVLLNAMYEMGLFTGSKKDFMQRIADALGCPGIADYSKQLYKAKWTNKYSEIFRKLAEVAEQEKTKDN